MSIELLTLCLILSVFLVFVTGLPVAFSLGSVSMLFTIFLWGPHSLQLITHAALGSMTSFMLVAIPLFILMGNILERSGLAETLFKMVYLWMGPVKGGLAIGTVVICTAMAAMVGVIGAGIVTMGVIALPSMLRRGYNKELAMGAIMAGGALGALIPPSVAMILYSSLGKLSIGKMFLGGIIPGLILSFLYMAFIWIKCYLNPSAGPALSSEETVTWRQKFAALRDSILPMALIVLVLGSIFIGAATPTEASAVGAFGAFLTTVFYRKFSWRMLKEACFRTLKLFSMVMWILIGASCFSRFYMAMGAADLVKGLVTGSGINPWLIIIGMQISLIVLGMLMEDYAIIMIAAPIYIPIVTALGFDPLWFGILFIINMQIAVLTPPYGFALFYMKGLSNEITMAQLYRSIIPFVPLQAVGLVLVMIFPKIALWLPGLMFE
ncbi:MAG: TRAP transporter large permease subunit [Nanoarchaeota archaeon]|nr:TRAP transporter large permease subunit [Nanoarchaeota archaeon]MBU4353041.1 TRAP transporter large permease subunit [Nanoarchaeota archaeon]